MALVDKKAPELRFKGFTEDWEQCKLGDAVSVTMGQSPNGENYTENPNDNILVQGNADMQNGKVVPRVWTTQITKTAEPGDIILSVRAPVGDVGKTNFNVVLGRGVAGIKGNDYIYQYLIRMKEIGYWTRVSTGSTFESINSNDLKDAVINSPSQNEQYKIGEFFFKLDKTITLHQRKLNQLKDLKQAYLQQLFASDGEYTPKVRFANFNRNWEQCKLYKIADLNPKSVIPEIFEYVDLESVVGIELIGHRTEYKYSAPSRAQRLAQNNDIFFQTVRPYQKNNYLYELPYNNYVFSTGYAQIRPRNNGYFLLNLVQEESFVNKVLERCTGTSYPAINSNDLAEIPIRVPVDTNEEIQIGNFFKQLDKNITFHQQKLIKLERLKSAYLQKMFI